MVRISAHRRQVLDRLRTLPILRSATDTELVRIDRMMCEVDVSAGDVVTREGDRPRGFFLIVSGRAVVTVSAVERGVLGTGMFFGEIALVDHGPEPATVTALTPMRLRIATGREFAQLSEMRPFARAILQTMVARERLALEFRPTAHLDAQQSA